MPREVTVCGAALQAASPGPFLAQSPAQRLRSSSLLKLALRGVHAGTRITCILAPFSVPDHPCRNQNNIHIRVLAIPGTMITSHIQLLPITRASRPERGIQCLHFACRRKSFEDDASYRLRRWCSGVGQSRSQAEKEEEDATCARDA